MRIDFKPVSLPSGGNIGGLLNQANNSFVSSFDRLAANLDNVEQKNRQKTSNALIPQLAGITTQEQADSFLSSINPKNITPELANHLVGLKRNAQTFQSNALKQDGTRAVTANTNAQTDVLRNEDSRNQTAFERKNNFEDALNNLAPQLLGSSLDAADGINGGGTDALRGINTNGVNIRDLLSIVDGNQGREQRGDSNRDTTRTNQQTFDNNNLVNADANRVRDFNFANAQRDDDLAQEDLRQAKAGQRAAFNLNATSVDRQAADQAYLNDPTISPQAKAAYLAQIEAIPATASAPSFESQFRNPLINQQQEALNTHATTVAATENAARSNDSFRRVARLAEEKFGDDKSTADVLNEFGNTKYSEAEFVEVINDIVKNSRTPENPNGVSPAIARAIANDNLQQAFFKEPTLNPLSLFGLLDGRPLEVNRSQAINSAIEQANPENIALAAERNRLSERNINSSAGQRDAFNNINQRLNRVDDLINNGNSSSNLIREREKLIKLLNQQFNNTFSPEN